MESKDSAAISSSSGGGDTDFKRVGSDYKLQEAPSAKEVAISGGYEQIYVILKNESPVDAKVSCMIDRDLTYIFVLSCKYFCSSWYSIASQCLLPPYSIHR